MTWNLGFPGPAWSFGFESGCLSEKCLEQVDRRYQARGTGPARTRASRERYRRRGLLGRAIAQRCRRPSQKGGAIARGRGGPGEGSGGACGGGGGEGARGG